MTRKKSALKPPVAGLSLEGFPTQLVKADAIVFRAHDAHYESPWFFSSDEGGRFNLSLPRGTCYAAEDTETAVRERLGDIIVASGAVESDLASAMAVTGVVLRAGVEVAAVNEKSTVRFGLTREIGTVPDYSVTRRWAELFADAGLGGIHYCSRFTTEAAANAWALFGTAGPAPTSAFHPASRVEGISACEAAGLRVLPAELDDDTTRVVMPPVQ